MRRPSITLRMLDPHSWSPDSPARDQARLALWLVMTIAVAAFAAGMIHAWDTFFFFLFILFGLPSLALILVIGTGVLLVRGFRQLDRCATLAERLLAVLAGPAQAALALALFLSLYTIGGRIGDLTKLAINQPRYEAIITRVQRNPSVKSDNALYYVEAGPPVRVAFDPVGMGDNWSAIVFDPTGEMMQSDRFDAVGKFRAPERITKLFGGDLVGCRALWDDYYKCGFT